MLGEIEESFRGNWFMIAVFGIISIILAKILVDGNKTNPTLFTLIIFLLFASSTFLVYWLFTVKITIYTDGISSDTFLSRKKMRWDDVVRLTDCSYIKLENGQGEIICIGDRANRKKRLYARIIDHTFPLLLPKVIEQFKNGAEVDFGLIKLSEPKGLTSRGLLNPIEVPIEQVTDYRIDDGWLKVYRMGKIAPAIAVPYKKVHNGLVLEAILDRILESDADDHESAEKESPVERI